MSSYALLLRSQGFSVEKYGSQSEETAAEEVKEEKKEEEAAEEVKEEVKA